jgi:hypothetical protein
MFTSDERTVVRKSVFSEAWILAASSSSAKPWADLRFPRRSATTIADRDRSTVIQDRPSILPIHPQGQAFCLSVEGRKPAGV